MDNTRKKIMLVDDNITNLLIGKNALMETYDVFTVPSGEKALKLLEKLVPDLILLDIEMPEMDGFETIRQIKSKEAISHIPIIFLTAKDDSASELEGLSYGAIDYIAKPFSAPLLLKRIEVHLLIETQKKFLIEQQKELQNYNDNLQHMVDEKTKTIVELQNAILSTITELVESRDDSTGGHIERTQLYLKALLDALVREKLYEEEVSTWDIDLLIQSAQLHDVGKIAIKDSILQKPGKLTAEEFEEMKRHTTFGAEIISKIAEKTNEKFFLEQAAILAETHHERWDGSGYPKGLFGMEIPLQGRLMAIADVFDALISERSYKKAFTHDEAVKIIVDSKGTHFEPILVNLFISINNEFEAIAKSV